MTAQEIKNLLTSLTPASPSAAQDDHAKLAASLNYLASPEALGSLEQDPYWPKWNSPWWHMVLLHEMGEAKRIPVAVVAKMVEVLDRYPVKFFPLRLEEIPANLDPYRHTLCHCALGNMYQVLASAGVEVDDKLPWIRPWFLRYQMEDGGLNCDNDAYLVEGECPSSMVATISVLEAVLLHTPRPFTAEEKKFLDKGAEFLISRRLVKGSPTTHNADERADEDKWQKLCFPRFYLYDVLRGLNAILLWAEKTKQPLSTAAISEAITIIAEKFPGGQLRTERLSYEKVGSILPSPSISGEWIRGQAASTFPLLSKVSAVGENSPYLSRQWADCVQRMLRLTSQGALN